MILFSYGPLCKITCHCCPMTKRTQTANGEYSASSAYQMQFDGSVASYFPEQIWHVWAPPKCKSFLVAHATEQSLDGRSSSAAAMDQQLFLPFMLPKLGDSYSSVCRVSGNANRLAAQLGSMTFQPQNLLSTHHIDHWFADLTKAAAPHTPSQGGLRSFAILICVGVYGRSATQEFSGANGCRHQVGSSSLGSCWREMYLRGVCCAK